ncbi:hypothetical protein QFZ77_002953 [Paenibacillus sp. V4I3]|nr:hypothetical protein [Paenibacillus sp. V4I3]
MTVSLKAESREEATKSDNKQLRVKRQNTCRRLG